MLKQLTIKNLAIIDDITIDFDNNFNVLTGETGAGKSIIIDAISLVFGARANNDIIQANKDSATIFASLEVNLQVAKYIYENFDIDVSDEFIITRILNTSGKSVSKINGIIVPLHTINQISNILIDISSQNESQYLFNKKNHLAILDSYIKGINKEFKDDFIKSYNEYNSLLIKYNKLANEGNDEDVEYLNFKISELKDYNYTIADEEQINNEYKELTSQANNAETLNEIIDLLYDNNDSSISTLYNALKMLGKINNNEKINNYYEKLNSLYLDLTDFANTFSHDFDTSNIDFNRIDYLSNEITTINRLKRKYKSNDLLSYKNELLNKIELINNKEVFLSKLSKQLLELKQDTLKKAKILSSLRKKYAKELQANVIDELKDLYLNDAIFEISFKDNTSLSSDGIDDVEFYMSANKGVPLMPLIKVASGGEASRIMLGLKSSFSKLSMTDIIIFDEIDTGVSGKVALAIGRKMAKIAKNCQVLAITHLPQVAALSDHHFYISKAYKDKKTITNVKKLNNNEKIYEIARLLSGDEITNSFLESAKELISSK
ncbi:MAG: DNA repair protein RecN [Candidatus Caccosoma sp.]|nr:DNA repair protein RecN [Candidatus Caccosoma sp.]